MNQELFGEAHSKSGGDNVPLALIGLDLGSTAVKGVALDVDGAILARAQHAMKYSRDGLGRVEFDVEKHFLEVCGLIRELSTALPTGTKVAGISMAAASGNTLMLGVDSKPISNVISWMDNRPDYKNNEILPELHNLPIHEIVGWRPIPTFPLAHLSWFKENEAEKYCQASRFCMNTDYLLFRLTGKWAMDQSTATTFFLQDQKTAQWRREFLDILNISQEQLSKLSSPGTPVGNLTPEAAEACALDSDTLVVLGSFDHPSAARGVGVLEPGQMLLSCGTSWVGFYPEFKRENIIGKSILCDPFLSPDGPWGAIFSLSKFGQDIDSWVAFCTGSEDGENLNFDGFNELASKGEIGALSTLIDLKDDPKKHKNLLNENSIENLARGVIEAAAMAFYQKIKGLFGDELNDLSIYMVGGPTQSPVWTGILADVLGVELKLLSGQYAGAVGAAVLAGIGAGIFENEKTAFANFADEGELVKPDNSNYLKYQKIIKESFKS